MDREGCGHSPLAGEEENPVDRPLPPFSAARPGGRIQGRAERPGGGVGMRGQPGGRRGHPARERVLRRRLETPPERPACARRPASAVPAVSRRERPPVSLSRFSAACEATVRNASATAQPRPLPSGPALPHPPSGSPPSARGRGPWGCPALAGQLEGKACLFVNTSSVAVTLNFTPKYAWLSGFLQSPQASPGSLGGQDGDSHPFPSRSAPPLHSAPARHLRSRTGSGEGTASRTCHPRF